MEMVIFWLVCAFFCSAIAVSKGRHGFGWFLLGLCFSIFALIAILIAPSLKTPPGAPTPETHVRCPDCKELVLKEASVCKHCHCKLVPQT